ncbi:hypothetical protein N0V88_003105 [Collariella sp. IMI 366227]|nr:hypothetical protein N0V88_003105 [Collariella sp. IMI 366227]
MRMNQTNLDDDNAHLLNEDILDVTSRYVPHNWDSTLARSQIGLTYWSEVEKTLLFEALARLGRDDAAGIAARLKTKSELEVADFLSLLDKATRKKKEAIAPADIPAAVELSQACCAALEEAADARRRPLLLAHHPSNLPTLLNTATPSLPFPPPLLTLFRLPIFLHLSSHLFMNSSVDEYNWRAISSDPPAIRATALADFHTLVVSVTRRLVAATIFVADARHLPKQDAADIKAVTREMNEVLVHSALEYPKSRTARANLRERIRAERAHEDYADALDARASYHEEKRLWGILERQPPVELVKVEAPERAPRCTKRGVEELEIVPSRWEMDYALAQEEKKKKAKAAPGAESGDEY